MAYIFKGNWHEPVSLRARTVPPRTANETLTALTATVSSAAIATGMATTDVAGRFFWLAVSTPFNVTFGGSGVAASADNSVFPAGLYVFWLTPADTHYTINAHANGTAKGWR